MTDERLTPEQHQAVREMSALYVQLGVAALGPIAYLEHDAEIHRLRARLSVLNDEADLAVQHAHQMFGEMKLLNQDRLRLLEAVHMLITTSDVPPGITEAVQRMVAKVGERKVQAAPTIESLTTE